MPVVLRSLTFLGAVLFTALASSGCAVAYGNRPIPKAADSTLARWRLQEVITAFAAREADEHGVTTNGQVVSQLPDISLEHVRDGARFARSAIRRLDNVWPEALKQDDYITLLTLRSYFDVVADSALYYWHDLSSITAETTPLRRAAEIFGTFKIESSGDGERYLYLLESLPLLVDTLRWRLEEQRVRGIVLSRGALSRTQALVRTFMSASDSSILRVAPERVATLDTALTREFLSEIDDALRHRVRPALERLDAFLSGEYATLAPVNPGLAQYPGGREYYRFLVRRWTSLDVTPEQVHEIGVRETARIESELAELRKQFGVTVARDAFHDSLRHDSRFSPVSPESLAHRLALRYSAWKGSVDTIFIGREVARLVVHSGAPLETGDRILGAYFPAGTLTPDAAIYVPGATMLTAGAAMMTDAIASFALIPGLHLMAGVRDTTGSFSVIRQLASARASLHGWGLYASEFARDFGAYEAPLDEYGRLALEGIMAARLVIDTGIHYFGWTPEVALAFLRKNSILTESEASAEVRRLAEAQPGQALAAGMGVHELRAMERWMRRELGDQFDRRAFYRELVTIGPVPLPVLALHLEWWLWKERTKEKAVS